MDNRGYALKPYTGKRYHPVDWPYYCFNKYGKDIGFQIRRRVGDKIINSQKVYFCKGDKYKQHPIMMEPDDIISMYFDDRSKELLTRNQLYIQSNDGDHILSHWIVIDHDFDHKPVDLSLQDNALFKVLSDLDQEGFKYSVYCTEAGRGIKILLKFPGLLLMDKRKRFDIREKIMRYIYFHVLGELFKAGKQCPPLYPHIEGTEPIHPKTDLPIKLIHYTGDQNQIPWFVR